MLFRADLSSPTAFRIVGVPALRTVLTASFEDKTVYAEDDRGRLIGLDLQVGTCCGPTLRARAVVGSPDGEVLGIDSTGNPIRISERAVSRYGTRAVTDTPALLRGPGEDLVLASPASGVARVLGSDGEVRQLKIPAGQLVDTWSGDLFAVVTSGGVRLFDPSGHLAERAVSLSGTPVTAVFSPSGHRLYVARQRGDLVQIDRFSGESIKTLALPGVATALRADRSGHWLLARPAKGDSLWAIDLTTWTVAGTVKAPWERDLPTVTTGRTLLVRRGKDVVAIDLTRPGFKELSRIVGAADDLFLALPWIPKSVPSDLTPALATTVVSPAASDSLAEVIAGQPVPVKPATPAPAGAVPQERVYIQVSSSQNQEWARTFAQQLHDGGYPARVLDPEQPQDGYRVVIGPYATREEADAVGKRLGRTYFLLTIGPEGT